MSIAVPDGARCAQHAESLANWVCPRCGAFFCELCSRRVRPEATPMCPRCWDLRSTKVADLKLNKHGMQNAALVMGLFSLIPVPEMSILQLATIIVSIVAMVKGDSAVIWRPVVGLICSVIGFGAMIAIVANG